MTAVRIERRATDAAAEPLRCTVLPPRSTPTAPAVLRSHPAPSKRFWTLIGAARNHRSITRGSAVSANATFAHSIRAEAVKTRDPPSIRSVAPWVPRASMSAVSSSKCSVHVMPQFSFKTCVVFMACRSPSSRQSPSRTRLSPTTGAR
jgi:hypothetical protein